MVVVVVVAVVFCQKAFSCGDSLDVLVSVQILFSSTSVWFLLVNTIKSNRIRSFHVVVSNLMLLGIFDLIISSSSSQNWWEQKRNWKIVMIIFKGKKILSSNVKNRTDILQSFKMLTGDFLFQSKSQKKTRYAWSRPLRHIRSVVGFFSHRKLKLNDRQTHSIFKSHSTRVRYSMIYSRKWLDRFKGSGKGFDMIVLCQRSPGMRSFDGVNFVVAGTMRRLKVRCKRVISSFL